MSWCCINAEHSETDAVEINLRSTLDATEAWLEMCKAKRAHNGRQRRANEARRTKLEHDRNSLFEDKERAHEALQKIQVDINAIDLVISKLEDAEAEIERLDHELELEEMDMKSKEESIQEHLALISNLAITGSAGTGQNGTAMAVENILNNGTSPISNRNLKSIKSPIGAASVTPSTGYGSSRGLSSTRLPYLIQPQRRLSLMRNKSTTTIGESPIAPPSTTASPALSTNGPPNSQLPNLPVITA